MTKRTIAIVGATISFLMQPNPVVSEGTIVQVDTASMELGQPPKEFEFERTGTGPPGNWVIVQDPMAIQGRAIAQTSIDPTDNRFPLAIYKPVSAKNIQVTLRFKPIAGKVDQAGGIAVRVKTPDDYYVVRANALEDNIRFYRVVKGRRVQIADAEAKVSSGQWHTLSLKALDARFTISFDDKELYTVDDRTFTDAGKVALWTKADSVTHFDQITIQVLQ